MRRRHRPCPAGERHSASFPLKNDVVHRRPSENHFADEVRSGGRNGRGFARAWVAAYR